MIWKMKQNKTHTKKTTFETVFIMIQNVYCIGLYVA